MFTTTTYGTWLPGDLRGYVDNGIILPHNPATLERARGRMLGDPVYLTRSEQDAAFEALLATCTEFNITLLAASIESWHAHLFVDHGYARAADTIGRLKTRMRQAIVAIRSAPPAHRIWTTGYDARFCFEPLSVTHRQTYVNRHRGARPIPRLPHPHPPQ